MEVQTVVFANFPHPDDLCCVVCTVDVSKIRDTIIKTPFHCQVLVCRLIIKTVRCAIAAPVPSMYHSIYVIVTRSFFNTGRLQSHLSNIHVQCSEPQAVNIKIYITCLKYTFTFHLAPAWNLVGQHYLYKENFLQLSDRIDAMNLDISIDEEWSKLILRPIKVNVYHVKIYEFGLPHGVLQSFLADPKGRIDLTFFKPHWVHVIPSMKKGKLLSVSKVLPSRCPFKCYEDFRRHWKNMYAYRLPKDSNGMLFYEVSFPPYSTDYFTYPELCLRCRPPTFLDCPNRNELTKQFLMDLTINVQNVCGQVLEISNRFPKLDIEFNPQKQMLSTMGTSSGHSYATPIYNSGINRPTQLSSIFTFGSNREPLSSNPNLTSRLNSQTLKMSPTKAVFKKFANHKNMPPNIQNSLHRLANYCGINDENKFSDTGKNLQCSPETITNFSQASGSSYFTEPKQHKRSGTFEEAEKDTKRLKNSENQMNTPASSFSMFSDYRDTTVTKVDDDISQFSNFFCDESFPGEDEMFNNIGMLHDSQVVTSVTSTTQYSENSSDTSFRIKQ